MRDNDSLAMINETGSESSTTIVAVREISKRFGHVRVLRRLSVSFQRGEVTLLLGANGAGKSTLLRILAGLTRPDGGSVYTAPSASIGFFSHNLSMYGRLTARENLDLFRRVADLSRGALNRAEELWDLGECADKQVTELSKGTQARVSLARVFMTAPSVVLLDEPTSNLDNKSTEGLIGAVRSEAECRCVVIATHDIHRLRVIATRVLVVDRGEIFADSGAGATQSSISRVIDCYLESNR